LRFPASGLIAGRRATSGVAAGDTLYWIVTELAAGDAAARY
jgi:hypothetical protein